MKIIINNASMTFVKGVLNIFENSTWLDGQYWQRNTGSAMALTAVAGYYTIETPLSIPQGVSRVKVTWDTSIQSSGSAKLRCVWWGADDKVLETSEHEGGSLDIGIPSGAVKFAVQGQKSSGATAWGKVQQIKGVFE